MRLCRLPLVVFGLSVVYGQTMTPRELFYTPVVKQTEAKTPTKFTPATVPVPKKKDEVAHTTPAKEKPAAKVTTVAFAPLGLRYSLMLSTDGSSYNEVDAETIFHSGDKLKVTAQSNDPAHLYVVARGSSGNWKVMFPAADAGGGNNKVEPMKSYELPPGGRFYFDDNAGEEKLFIVLSRKPVDNLEALIYDLGKSKKEASPERPMLLAERIAPIDDALVGRLRAGVQSRDLVFEKVDEKTAGERKEKAVYVVNTKNVPNARLVVDLTLKHK
jgi:hypothetical protein